MTMGVVHGIAHPPQGAPALEFRREILDPAGVRRRANPEKVPLGPAPAERPFPACVPYPCASIVFGMGGESGRPHHIPSAAIDTLERIDHTLRANGQRCLFW